MGEAITIDMALRWSCSGLTGEWFIERVQFDERSWQWHAGRSIMMGYKPQLPELDSALVKELVRRIVRSAHPERIILFGSRARGDHRPDSDIDLLVVQDSMLPRHKRSLPLYAALSELSVPVDMELVVYTPDEVREWSAAQAAFVTTALREGRVLYEK